MATGVGLGRRRHRDRAGVVDVVEKPDGHSALVRGEEGGEDERACVRLEANVVQREVEALRGTGDERCGLSGDGERRLPAVPQQRQLDRRVTLGCAQVVRSDALHARFSVRRSARGSSTRRAVIADLLPRFRARGSLGNRPSSIRGHANLTCATSLLIASGGHDHRHRRSPPGTGATRRRPVGRPDERLLGRRCVHALRRAGP